MKYREIRQRESRDRTLQYGVQDENIVRNLFRECRKLEYLLYRRTLQGLILYQMVPVMA